jgi:hypothetical protein
MNAWVRLYGSVETDSDSGSMNLTMAVSSKIRIVIHGTEQAARAAAAKFGGLVMEMNLGSLKGASEFPEIGLHERDDNDGTGTDDGKADTVAFFQLACDAIPHKRVFQSFNTGETTDTPPVFTGNSEDDAGFQELIDLLPEGCAFADAVSEELGVWVGQ